MRTGARVRMPRHLHRSWWDDLVYGVTGLVLFTLWLVAIVMVMP